MYVCACGVWWEREREREREREQTEGGWKGNKEGGQKNGKNHNRNFKVIFAKAEMLGDISYDTLIGPQEHSQRWIQPAKQ